jgi:hypothetical protein
MPSPFPGMDPFLESQAWQDFHTSYLVVLRELLVAQLRPRYVVEIGQYLTLSSENMESCRAYGIGPSLMEQPDEATKEYGTPTDASGRAKQTLPVLRRLRQRFLTIRATEKRNAVTVIEILSLSSKCLDEGRKAYFTRRTGILSGKSNLVEIDLLRSGLHPVVQKELPAIDYSACISRCAELSKANVLAWKLNGPLPSIPIPLAEDDPDAMLDLQVALTTTYDRAGYDYALNYRAPVEPPMEPAAAEWVRSVLSERN